MIRRIIKGNFLHALYRLQLFHQRICVLPGNIRHHDPGAAICHKLFIHQGQTNSRLTVCRQIFGNILIYRYFIHACCTVNTRNGKQYQKSFSFVDNKGCYCQPKIPFFLFFFHSIHSLTSAFHQKFHSYYKITPYSLQANFPVNFPNLSKKIYPLCQLCTRTFSIKIKVLTLF